MSFNNLNIPEFDGFLRSVLLLGDARKVENLVLGITEAANKLRKAEFRRLLVPPITMSASSEKVVSITTEDKQQMALYFLSLVTWKFSKIKPRVLPVYRSATLSKTDALAFQVGSSFQLRKNYQRYTSWSLADPQAMVVSKSESLSGLVPVILKTIDLKGRIVWSPQSMPTIILMIRYVNALQKNAGLYGENKLRTDLLRLLKAIEELRHAVGSVLSDKEYILYHPIGLRVTRVD